MSPPLADLPSPMEDPAPRTSSGIRTDAIPPARSAAPALTGEESGLGSMPDAEESTALVRAAQQGDRSALNSLIDHYQDRVYRIVRIRLGARLRQTLESGDIVNKTFMKAAEKLPEFERRTASSLINWLAAIAENQIRDAHKRISTLGNSQTVPLDDVLDDEDVGLLAHSVATDPPSPSSIVANAEIKEIYDSCVEALPEKYREVILLREYSGTSWEETTKHLGIVNVQAAQQMYQRAQVKLAGFFRQRMRE